MDEEEKPPEGNTNEDPRALRSLYYLEGLLFANGMANYMLRVLVTFLTDIWKIDLIRAVKIINIQSGASAILGFSVASLADHQGHYWIVLLTSILYCVGLGLLATSVPRDRGIQTCPSGAKICAENLKSSPFYWALALIIVARAGQFVSLRALSFGKLKCIKLPRVQGPWRRCRFGPWRCTQRPISARQKQKNWAGFLCGTFLAAGAFTASVGFFSFHNDWHSRFVVSACVMAGGILVFLSGYSFHPPAWVRQSPLWTILKGFYVTAVERIFTNRHIRPHPRNDLDAGHIDLVNLNPHLFEEDSAISDQGQNQRFFYVFGGWVRCTEDQRNEIKLLLSMIPISATFIMYGLVKSNSDTFFVEQGKSMERSFRINTDAIHIAGKIPIQLFIFFTDGTSQLMGPLYRIIFEKRISRINARYSHAMKVGLGLLAGLFSSFVASFVEAKRLKSLKDHGLLNKPDGIAPISIFWLTPQFVLTGMMDGLAYDGMKDFFERNVHASMTRYGVVLRNVATGMGKLLNVVFVLAVDKVVVKVKGKDASWFAETVNGGHLDYFFRAVVVVSLLNLLVFAYAATYYPYPQVEFTAVNDEEVPLEEVANVLEIV